MAAIRLEHVSKRFQASARLSVWPGGTAAVVRPLAEAMVRQLTHPEPTVEEDSREAVTGGPRRGQALDDVSLDINDGETLSVIGPSGCGKTTLLRVIAGLEPPDTGRVLYDGVDMANVPPKDRGIGMVFQSYALYPHMKGRGNLSFFFRMHHREDEIDERVRITARMMGLGFDELLERRPSKLSGGQRQRVAIARCIIRDPRLFLFDEPLSSLDAKLRAQTRVEIKRLLSRFRITSVYVTHDQVEAVALADRIAVMREGRVEQVGTYWDVYLQPANCFVASFLGTPSVNLLPARIDGDRVVLGDGQSFALPEHWQRAGAVTANAIIIGIRPEHVRLLDLSTTEGLLAHVEVVERLPSERVQLVHLHARGWECIAKVSQTEDVRTEKWMRVMFDPERLLLFDKATERRMNA